MNHLFPRFPRTSAFLRKHFVGIASAAILLGCWAMLEFSCILHWEHFYEFTQKFQLRFALLNYLTLGIFWSVFYLFSRRLWVSDLVCTLLCSVISIANHYVLKFHSMPMSFLLIRNLTTAMNVIDGYQFTIDFSVATLIIVSLLLAVLSILVARVERRKPPVSLRGLLIRGTATVLGSICIFYLGYFGPNPMKPKNTISWVWTEGYYAHGYLACSIETLCQMLDSINAPDGYAPELLKDIEIQAPPAEKISTPDIILILNETFYDPKQLCDLETDIPYLPNIETMEGLLSGLAVVPGTGGGTNVAEYELLTSNSTWLMPGITPFNTLNLSNANSIVSHLRSLGYTTIGCHPSLPENYSRSVAYPTLGFHHAYFRQDLLEPTFYGTRPHETDESFYNNMIRWYEDLPENQPRFLYGLTLQNHGNWNMNAPEHDIVHSLTDFGDDTAEVNEFLSCLYLSDQAFKGLTDYFSTVDRPVIICMVGDHSPTLQTSIQDSSMTHDEVSICSRTLPLLIWANYELPEIELGTISMNFVVPTLLDIADVPLSPYYSYILQLKEQVPVISSFGSYFDADGNMYRYDSDEGSPYEAAVNNYFYLEYNNLQEERQQSFFSLWP